MIETYEMGQKMNLPIKDLYELAKDRPLVTSEVHSSNDFYGHATILKKYAQIPPEYQIKAAIEHGPFGLGFVWDVDIKSRLPAIFVFAQFRYPIIKRKTNKALFSIGPILDYAPHFLDTETLNMEKQRVGKNLLAFPPHSTHWVNANYDIHGYCKILEGVGKQFDSIRICLYWKDVLSGLFKEYMKHGFECVTAGHIYDPLFLPRLKSIIELATVTTSSTNGTHIGYCILMNKPHFMTKIKVMSTAENDEILRRDTQKKTKENSKAAKEIWDAFSEIRSDISQKQNEIANRYWGFSEFKTAAEMRLIFQTTEDMYKKGLNFYMSARDVLTEQALDYLNSNDNEKALFLLNQSIAVNPDMPTLNYGKAVALCRLGQIDDAAKTLSDLLAVVPDHQNGRLLFKEIKIIDENQFKKTDIAIASYPRSGNTWLRALLADIILQIHNFKTDTGLPIHADRVIPDIYEQRLHEIDPRINLPCRLIKTHEQFSSVPMKTVCLFRDAADALCSHFHFHRRYDHLQNKTVEGIDAFCKKNLKSWIENVNSYILARNQKRGDIFFISYEWLSSDPEIALFKLAKFIGLDVNKNICKIAVENHKFNKHRKSEERGGTVGKKYHEYFYRKGKVGGSAEELRDETLHLINEKSATIYQRAASFQLCSCSEDVFSIPEPSKRHGLVNVVDPDLWRARNINEVYSINDKNSEVAEKLMKHNDHLTKLLNQKITMSDLLGESQQPGKPCDNISSSTTTNLKVVHLCMQDFGGAGKAAYRLHSGLQSIGIDSTMLVLNKRSGDPSVRVLPNDYSMGKANCLDVSEYNSPVWNQQAVRWQKLILGYPTRPAGLEVFTDAVSDVRLDRVQEIQNADIINLHWVAGSMDCPSVPLAIGSKPIIWTLHDMNPFTGGCHYAGDCKKYIKGCGACPQLGSDTENDLAHHVWKQKYDAYKALNINIVTPSRWLGQCASESKLFSPFPVTVIPYGFPLNTFRPYPKEEVRKALNIPESAKVILFGADSVVNERKGFKYLLEALNKLSLRNEHDSIILTFGRLPEGVKITSKYPIFNLGSIADESQLAKIYSAADVYVIPSLEDNLPNTVVEAMACGVPVVGFDIGGIPDMIEHKKTGYLVKPKDIAGLIEGIDWVISSTDNGINFLKQCREKVEKKYALEVQAKAYKDLYKRTLQDHSSWIENIQTKAKELNQQGEDLFSKGDIDGALIAFTKAVEINPNYATAYNNLGVLYLQTGEAQKAVEHFTKAMEINPNDRDTILNCGELFKSLGENEDAMDIYSSYLQKNPNDEEIAKALENLQDKRSVEVQDEKYLVSAIVSTYNSERFIRGCLEDLEAQTISDKLEIIVVNSASEQNEEAIIREFQAKYPNIKYIKTEQRETVYAAWNRGIKAASGEYITNANTDDRHRADAFEVMARTLDNYPGIGFVYADCLVTEHENETYESNNAEHCFTFPEFSLRQLMMFCYFGPQPMWRRSFHDKIGYFREDLVVAGDYDFGIRAAWHYGAMHIRELLGLYLLNSTSLGNDNLPKSFAEARELIRKYRDQIPIEDFYPMLKEMPEDVNARAAALVDFGNCALQSKYPDTCKATELYKEALELCGGMPLIRNNMAVTRFLGGDKNLSIQILVDLKDQVPLAQHNLKLIQSVTESKIPSAFRLYNLEHAVVDSLPALVTQSSMMSDNYDGNPIVCASTNFSKSAITRTNKPEDKLKRGEALFADGKIKESENCFLEILKGDTKNTDAYNNLGVIALQQQNEEQAINYFTKALEIDPFHKDAILNYAVLLKDDRLYEISPILEKVVEKFPNDQEFCQLLSEARLSREAKTKIAFLCMKEFTTFLGGIVNYLQQRFEVRTCYSDGVEEIRQAISWADIVWLEWANERAIGVTNKIPEIENKKVICRVHSYEVLSGLITLVDWTKVSRTIFVADHIRRIALELYPDLSFYPDSTVINNGVDLERFPFKERTHGYDIAVVGYIEGKKNPSMWIEVISRLVKLDSRYTLHIAGELNDQRYKYFFDSIFAKTGLYKNVKFYGKVENMPEWHNLCGTNYLLSTSIFESFGYGIAEAMIMGIKPLIYNYLGAEEQWPESCLWESVDDLIELIRNGEYDAKGYSEFVKKNYSMEKQLEKIEKLILEFKPIEKHRTHDTKHNCTVSI